MMQDVDMKFNLGLTWQKQHSTRWRPFFISKLDLQFKEEITPAFGAHLCVVLKFKYFRK
jgi:hypothetical protein